MKSARGASAIFYLFVAIAFVILLLAVPLPSYNVSSRGWFLDKSLGQRLIGQETEGVPLYEVATDLTKSSVTSPLDLTCQTDSDCREYVVANQCESYCGNINSANAEAVTQLNNRRVCDPTEWSRPSLRCGCIAGKCLNLN